MAIVPQGVLMSRMAVAWPLVAVVILAALIVTSHILALLSGKCDREDPDTGALVTAYVSEISFTTERPPESYIWTIGVAVTWMIFLCPTLALLHVMLWEIKRGWFHAIFLILSEVLFFVATLALLGLATVTGRGTILEDTNVIPDGRDLHHNFANSFFFASYLQGGSFLISQCFRWNTLTHLEKRSFRWKVLVILIVTLSASGLVPFLIVEALPPLRSNSQMRSMNTRGLTQRLVVFGMMIFTASYAFDIRALQHRLKEKSSQDSEIVLENPDMQF